MRAHACVFVCVCLCVCVCVHNVCMLLCVCVFVWGSVSQNLLVGTPGQRLYVCALLTVDFSSTDLLIDFKITLLFCWHVQQRSLIGLPTVMNGSSLVQ